MKKSLFTFSTIIVFWFIFAGRTNSSQNTSIGNNTNTNSKQKNHDACSTENFKKKLSEAQSGNPKAEDELGDMYLRACGTKGDDKKTMFWYKKAANKGNSDAQYSLYLFSGMLAPKDYKQSNHWLMQSAKNSNPIAQYMLASCYRGGDCPLINKNIKKGFYWLAKASMGRNTCAMYDIGVSYMYGTQVSKDYIKAYTWLNLLYTYDPDSIKPIKKLEKLMTSAQINIAQKRSLELFQKINNKKNSCL